MRTMLVISIWAVLSFTACGGTDDFSQDESSFQDSTAFEFEVFEDGRSDLNVRSVEPDPNSLLGSVTKQLCTSFSIHCTTITVSNAAKMTGPNTVNVNGSAVHTNNSVDFLSWRMEHRVRSWDDKTAYTTLKVTIVGDWTKSVARGLSSTYTKANGYRIYTRVCADIKDDGKGERCTGEAVTSAVW